MFFNGFYCKKLQKRGFGNINYNTDHNTDHDCTVYVNTDTESDSLSLHTPAEHVKHVTHSSFPVIHKVGNVVIFVLFRSET